MRQEKRLYAASLDASICSTGHPPPFLFLRSEPSVAVCNHAGGRVRHLCHLSRRLGDSERRIGLLRTLAAAAAKAVVAVDVAPAADTVTAPAVFVCFDNVF